MSIQRPKMYIPPSILSKPMWRRPSPVPTQIQYQSPVSAPAVMANVVQATIIKKTVVPPPPKARVAAKKRQRVVSKHVKATPKPPIHPTINMDSTYMAIGFVLNNIKMIMDAMRKAESDYDKIPDRSKGLTELFWIQQLTDMRDLGVCLENLIKSVKRIGIQKFADAKKQ